jgi:hypothetical protein
MIRSGVLANKSGILASKIGKDSSNVKIKARRSSEGIEKEKGASIE